MDERLVLSCVIDVQFARRLLESRNFLMSCMSPCSCDQKYVKIVTAERDPMFCNVCAFVVKGVFRKSRVEDFAWIRTFEDLCDLCGCTLKRGSPHSSIEASSSPLPISALPSGSAFPSVTVSSLPFSLFFPFRLFSDSCPFSF